MLACPFDLESKKREERGKKNAFLMIHIDQKVTNGLVGWLVG